jgi:GTPase SAR1 family protein
MKNGNVKILFLGATGTGKSSIIYRYHGKSYKEGPTVGVEVSSNMITNENLNPPTRIRLWDMGGARHWWMWIEHYIVDVDILFIFYDVTDKKTLEIAGELLDGLCKRRMEFRTILVGNKTDLESQRVVSMFDVNQFIGLQRSKGWQLRHIECSLQNITAFRKILDRVINGMKKINVPREFVTTGFNLDKSQKETSWGLDFLWGQSQTT